MILAFDTSAAHCAAALLSGDRILGVVVSEMSRGQAEHLFPLLEELFAEHEVAWSDLSRIGVGIGPGNFTGIRISVAAARGLALSLGIPAVGISSLEVQFTGQPVLATVPAPREQCYAQAFNSEAGNPALMLATEARQKADEMGLPMGTALPAKELVAEIARRTTMASEFAAPAPLYIRGADAAPPKDPAPVILP